MFWLPLLASCLLVQLCTAEPGKDQPKRLYDFGLGKRAAYTYVSEYKRLPIYNFGLGKRFDESLYPGKQNAMDGEDYEEDSLKDDYKRMKQYSFGLGKRLPMKTYSFGLGKRVPYDDDEAFAQNSYEEEEKRSGNGHRFSFGLGKRDGKQNLPGRRSMQYNFGLGKRSQLKDDTNPNFNL